MNKNTLNLDRLSHWLNQRQFQSLEEAYKGALEIKAIEDKFFDGGQVAYTANQSKTVFDYVKSLRDRQLLRVRVNLTQFRLGGFLLSQKAINQAPDLDIAIPNLEGNHLAIEAEATVLEKLKLIDSVIGKYRESEDDLDLLVSKPVNKPTNKLINKPANKPTNKPDAEVSVPGVSVPGDTEAIDLTKREPNPEASPETVDLPAAEANVSRRQSVPGSLLGRFKQIGKEMDPEYEQQVIREIRLRRRQDKTAVRWLVILLLIPIAIQITVKNLIFEPLLGSYAEKNPSRIELSQEIKEKFFTEFTVIKEGLEIQQLLGVLPEMSAIEKKKRLEESAVDIWRESRDEQLNGLKNVLADGVAFVAFAGIVYFGRNKLAVLRGFSNRTFLGLSDPAKVFLFILITDMFVGFHSAEGWEVILEGVAEHFGVPANKAAINGFIATIPVIIDSSVKFWIFNYLTRYSPSASAIYERMNT